MITISDAIESDPEHVDPGGDIRRLTVREQLLGRQRLDGRFPDAHRPGVGVRRRALNGGRGCDAGTMLCPRLRAAPGKGSTIARTNTSSIRPILTTTFATDRSNETPINRVGRVIQVDDCAKH